MRNLLLLFSTIISFTAEAQNLKSGGKLKPEQAIMDIRHYTVALDVDTEQKTINGYTEIDLNLLQSAGSDNRNSKIIEYYNWDMKTSEEELMRLPNSFYA